MAYYWEIVMIFSKDIIMLILTFYDQLAYYNHYSYYLHKYEPYNISFLNKLKGLSYNICSIQWYLSKESKCDNNII